MHTRENNEEHSQGVTLMTGGSVRRQIVRFALPVFWGNLFQQLYNIVDSLVVGNFLGSDALAAVGSSGHIIFLLVGLFSGLFTGASVVISGYFGAQEHQKMHTAIHTKFRAAGLEIAFPQRDVHVDIKQPLEIRLQPEGQSENRLRKS